MWEPQTLATLRASTACAGIADLFGPKADEIMRDWQIFRICIFDLVLY
jgi:hypothetical protein